MLQGSRADADSLCRFEDLEWAEALRRLQDFFRERFGEQLGLTVPERVEATA
jgi:hypothetical protein